MNRSSVPGLTQRHRIRITRGVIALAVALASSLANAAVGPLPGTGVSAAGAKLGGGEVDPHWLVVAGPGVAAPSNAIVVNNQHPLGFYFTSPDSTWIWANATATAVVGAPYTFDLSFDLTGYEASAASLNGLWGVDNTGSILLNGAPAVGTGTLGLNSVSTATFNTPYSFSITSGFVAGINHLQFQVSDAGNPAALNVGGLSFTAAPVPEPSSAMLLVVGISAVISLLRRRRPHRKVAEA